MSDTIEDRSGGADLNAGRDINVGGDVVGGDKIVITGGQQHDVQGLANPYLGLQSFTYADQAKYAGREQLIAETVARLTAVDDPLTLLFVTGASGSGKSSFVQAGILPALRKHYDKQNLEYAVFRPSRDPLAALSDAMWRQLGLPQFDAATDFGDFLKTHPPPQQVSVIVIDQFEELFTQSNAQPRGALFNLLTHLPPFRSAHTHIIATMRADYLPELFPLSELYGIAKRGVDLRAMSVDELREAIQQPLRATYPAQDKRFQPELVERLAHDSAEDAAYLPLLQVTLEGIWRKGTLALESYTNLADAIQQRADKVLAYQDYDAAQPDQTRTPEEQAAIMNLCVDLVDVSLDDEVRRDVRRRRSKDELIRSAPERAQLIDVLARARLFSVETEAADRTRFEVDIIHETLLSNWGSLQKVIQDRRDELRQRVRFEQQLKEWIGQGRPDGYLLSGVHLAEARDLERRDDIALRSADAQEYMRRSVESEDALRQKELNEVKARERAERRSNLALRVLAIVLLLVIAGLLWPYLYEAIDQGNARGEAVTIPRGQFVFGALRPESLIVNESITMREWPQQDVTLDAFQMDIALVTNYQYGLCVNHGKCSLPVQDSRLLADPAMRNHPVINVSVFQASVYCQWLGKRLPTEAEWERAARGLAGRLWPWGDGAPTPDRAHMPMNDREVITGTVPVAANPAGKSPEGVYGLIGNVWEWTSSFEGDWTAYQNENAWDSQPGSYDGHSRNIVIRGGGWILRIPHVTDAIPLPGSVANPETGFRCAKTLVR
jgi:formylglycine-generating enzyme required for sulfatase activity